MTSPPPPTRCPSEDPQSSPAQAHPPPSGQLREPQAGPGRAAPSGSPRAEAAEDLRRAAWAPPASRGWGAHEPAPPLQRGGFPHGPSRTGRGPPARGCASGSGCALFGPQETPAGTTRVRPPRRGAAECPPQPAGREPSAPDLTLSPQPPTSPGAAGACSDYSTSCFRLGPGIKAGAGAGPERGWPLRPVRASSLAPPPPTLWPPPGLWALSARTGSGDPPTPGGGGGGGAGRGGLAPGGRGPVPSALSQQLVSLEPKQNT